MLRPMIATKQGRAVPAIRIPVRESIHYWSPEELQRIIEYAPHFIAKVAFLIMACTGARVSELLELTYQHFDGINLVVRIPTVKQRRKQRKPIRIVPIPYELYDLVTRFAQAYNKKPDDRLITVSRQMVRIWVQEAARRAGLLDDRAHPHTFRHTFAMLCVKNSVNFWSLNDWLGHRDPMNTYVYVHLAAKDTVWDYPKDTFAYFATMQGAVEVE